MSRLLSLQVGGHCEPWQNLGLSFSGDACVLADVQVVVTNSGQGLLGWSFESDTDAVTTIDGIPTTLISHADHRAVRSPILNQAIVGLDHVVINTDNLDRTSAAIESVLHEPVRREREVGNGVIQRFHKLENTILEVITGPHITTPGASLWGMVASVDDLFELAEQLGDSVTSTPKRATQPGRYISTVRQSVGLGVPFALMTPHVSGAATH